MNSAKIIEIANGVSKRGNGQRPSMKGIDYLRNINNDLEKVSAPKKREIARLYVTGRFNWKQIATKVKMNHSYLLRLKDTDEELINKIEELSGRADLEVIDVSHRIKEDLAPKAVDIVEEMLNGTFNPENYPGTPVNLLTGVVKDTLSRAGHSPIRKSEVKEDKRQTFTHEEIRELRARSVAESIEKGKKALEEKTITLSHKITS